jgi:hypothetical protein
MGILISILKILFLIPVCKILSHIIINFGANNLHYNLELSKYIHAKISSSLHKASEKRVIIIIIEFTKQIGGEVFPL